MKLTSIELLNRSVYIGFGLLLGLQIVQLWSQLESYEVETNSVNFTTGSVTQTNRSLPDIVGSESDKNEKQIDSKVDSCSDTTNRFFIANIIQEEIRKQLEPLVVSINNIQTDNILPQKDARVQVQVFRQQQMTYESADKLLDDAISLGNWNYNDDSQLSDYIREMTPEQDFKIRVKYANAVNDGLISTDAPLGLMRK